LKAAEEYIDANLNVLDMQVVGIYYSLNEKRHDPDTFFQDITKPVLELWKTDEMILTIRKKYVSPPVDPIIAQIRVVHLFALHSRALRDDGNPEYSVAWAMEAHYQFARLEQIVDERVASIAKGRGAYTGKHKSFGKLWKRTVELARERQWPSKAEAAKQIAKKLDSERGSLGQYTTTAEPAARIKKWLSVLLSPLEHDQLFPSAKAARQNTRKPLSDEAMEVREYVPRMFLHDGAQIIIRPAVPIARPDLQHAYGHWEPPTS
jgi:hypothetical protein